MQNAVRAVEVIIREFLPARGLVAAGGGKYDREHILSELRMASYYRIDAGRSESEPDSVAIVAIAPDDNKYMRHAPDLKALLDEVHRGREKVLREVIVVADVGFHAKKNLTAVIRARQLNEAKTKIRYELYRITNFLFNILKHVSVPRHELLSPGEAAEFLAKDGLQLPLLPVIYSTDPPLVWLGARGGECAKITRDSQTAGTAIYLRRVVRAYAGSTK